VTAIVRTGSRGGRLRHLAALDVHRSRPFADAFVPADQRVAAWRYVRQFELTAGLRMIVAVMCERIWQ
jgi:hypothetical protein